MFGNIVAAQVWCRCCSFYHPSFELVTQQKFETGVVKRATSIFTTRLATMLPNELYDFCCLYYRALRWQFAICTRARYATSKKLLRDEERIITRRGKNCCATREKLLRDEGKIVARWGEKSLRDEEKMLRDKVDMSLLGHRNEEKIVTRRDKNYYATR